MISIVDGLKQSKIEMNFIGKVYNFIPLYKAGIGWILPEICGAFIVYLWGILKNDYSYQSEYDIKNNINN
ncbi:branched-chain amino acid ABC transporter [Bacillus pseudomycoides]|nr:branched-chain amino acid ABC transporter [Bacillus pseudomycoides]PHC82241.1 branched-chain amino acid ABC transporter [Bacillus pseudomycoides]